MRQDHNQAACFFKKLASSGISIGFILFAVNIFVSDYMISYILSALTSGIIIASLFLFGFGLCLTLMGAATAADRNPPKSYMEKMIYLYWR